MNKYLIVATFILVGLLSVVFKMFLLEKEKRIFIEDYKKGQGVVSQTSSKRQFKEYIDSLIGIETLKKAGIRPNSVTDVSRSTVNTTNILNVSLKDSITHKLDTLKCIDFNNGYTSIKGCFGKNIYPVHTHIDTLDIIRYKKTTKKILFIPIKKELRDTILNKDPNSKYTIKTIKYVNKKKNIL